MKYWKNRSGDGWQSKNVKFFIQIPSRSSNKKSPTSLLFFEFWFWLFHYGQNGECLRRAKIFQWKIFQTIVLPVPERCLNRKWNFWSTHHHSQIILQINTCRSKDISSNKLPHSPETGCTQIYIFYYGLI